MARPREFIPPKLHTINETAEYLSVSRRWLEKLIAAGEVETIPIGIRRKRVLGSSVNRWLARIIKKEKDRAVKRKERGNPGIRNRFELTGKKTNESQCGRHST